MKAAKARTLALANAFRGTDPQPTVHNDSGFRRSLRERPGGDAGTLCRYQCLLDDVSPVRRHGAARSPPHHYLRRRGRGEWIGRGLGILRCATPPHPDRSARCSSWRPTIPHRAWRTGTPAGHPCPVQCDLRRDGQARPQSAHRYADVKAVARCTSARRPMSNYRWRSRFGNGVGWLRFAASRRRAGRPPDRV